MAKKPEKRKSLNLTIDDDVRLRLKNELGRNTSSIISNLSREFLDQIQKEPDLLYHAMHGDICICKKDDCN